MPLFKSINYVILLCVLTIVVLTGCSSATTKGNGNLSLTSPAFTDGGNIPSVYSCDGQNTSPALNWSGAPAGTKSFVLILHDPDAPLTGGFTHWVVFNIPPQVNRLSAAVPKQATLTSGAIQGNNGAGNLGYTGPCPPAGPAHHYEFRLYALDQLLGLSGGATKSQVETAMNGHILEQIKLTGLFQRS